LTRHAIAGALVVAASPPGLDKHAAASLRHATTVWGRANVALTPTAKEEGSTPELEVRNLVKRYTAQSVVGPLSFSVARKAGLVD
jgi:hypothetical protein